MAHEGKIGMSSGGSLRCRMFLAGLSAWLLATALPAQDVAARFEERFRSEVWPLFGAGARSACLSCHAREGRTPLLLFRDPSATFKTLLAGGYLDPQNPAGLLARLTSNDPLVRMPPPPRAALLESAVADLRRFLTEI